MTIRLLLALALAVIAGACTEPASSDLPAVSSAVARIELPVAMNRKLDLLFVIDDSPGIAPHRAKLLDGYRRAIEVLESLPGGLPDLHLGVVTTDVGTRGAHDNGPGPSIGTGAGACTSDGDRGDLRRTAAVGGGFLSVHGLPDGTRERNFTGSLADAFVQLADVGAAGCTYARPLEAMRRALGGNPANAGFRREHAFLAVVFLTNDDDCSFRSASFATPDLDRSRCSMFPGSLVEPDEYATFLRSSGPDPQDVLLLGGFAPPSEPVCADARPAPRLAGFFDRFPNRSDIVSICEPDLGELLSLLSGLPKSTLGAPCFESPVLDVDPVADGLQPDCASWYSYLDGGEPIEETIPACRGGEVSPCWELRQDPQNCFSGGEGLVYRNQRQTFDETTDARAIIECVIR